MLKRAQTKKKNEVQKTSSTVSWNSSQDNKYWMRWIVWWVILLILVFWWDIWSIFSSSNVSKSSTQSSRDYSYSCIGSNGFSYTRPQNAFCDRSKTQQWWSCESWYTAVKGGGDAGWYCKCSSWLFSCTDYYQTKLNPMKDQYDNIWRYIDITQVNIYNHSAVNYYNSQIDKYNELASRLNRYMSENCDCG